MLACIEEQSTESVQGSFASASEELCIIVMDVITTIFILGVFYVVNHSAAAISLACEAGSPADIWESMVQMYDLKTRSHFKTDLCSRRVARYHKCMKRCVKRKRHHGLSKQGAQERCALMEAACALAKLHLPAPLPWRKKDKKKKTREQQQQQRQLAEDKHALAPETESLVSSVATDTHEAMQQQTHHGSFKTDTLATAVRPLSTPLIDLARMQNWELVVKQATRREAKHRDSDGLLPLHWAASGGPPVEVIAKLLDVYSSSARKVDKEGSSALHFATHYAASAEVVETLLKASPKTVRLQDRYGRSPLYHAVDKCSGIDVVKLLVRADPSMATVPCLPEEHRNLPLTRTTATMTPLYMAWIQMTRSGSHKAAKCKPFEKARLLLEAAFLHSKNVSPSIPRDFRFLSRALAMDLYLPEDIVPFAVREFSEELSLPDMKGRMPLAQAAATDFYSRERGATLIGLLLEAYAPAALHRDHDGKSPLQLALLSGKTWSAGVSRLFLACPEAVRWGDGVSGLPPFAAAASLEAQEAAAASNGLIGESPVTPLFRNDPYNLLTRKQKDLLERARIRLEGNIGSLDGEGSCADHEGTERLATIFDLLRAEPSVLLSSA